MLWLAEFQLRSRHPSKRNAAVETLCAAGARAASRAFLRALSHPNPEVRRTAIAGLRKVADDSTVAPLLKMLNDSKTEVVKTAILALRNTRTPEVQNGVAALLRHKDLGVRATAAQTLSALRWQPAAPEDQAWLLVARNHFASAAEQFGPLAVPALELVIANGPSTLTVRAVEALGCISSPDVPGILLQALNSSDAGVCTAAIDALGGFSGPEIIEPIMAILHHPNGQLRATAAEVMGRTRVTDAVEPLMSLTRDSQWDVRRAAVEALGRIRHKKSLDALTASLRDLDQDVREAAARALGNLRERKAIGPLVLTLCDKETSVRRITAASLSRILEDWSASPEAFATIDELRLFLQDGDQEVRRRATDLLASLIAAQQNRSTNTAENARLAATLFLDSIRDTDPDLRLAAAEALSRLADPQAQPALEQALTDSDPNVRAAAERGLLLLGLTASPTSFTSPRVYVSHN